MVGASLLFSLMGVAVKSASATYSAGELVMYRSVVGVAMMGAILRVRGISPRTQYPAMHFWRSASGSTAMALWFYSLAVLPLATAMTLNYMSSVWIALFLIGGAVLVGQRDKAEAKRGLDSRLVAAVILGFAGVALVLLLTIGVLATFGQWMMTRAYATGATLGIAALQYLAIAFSFALGVWLFDDPITPMAVAGMLLIAGAGVAASFLRSKAVPKTDAGPSEI